MRFLRACAVGAVFGAVLFVPTPAHAGGGWWNIVGHPHGKAVLIPGETVEVEGDVWVGNDGRGEEKGVYHAGPEHGPFYVYVAPVGPEGWGPYPPPVPDNAIRVAELSYDHPDRPLFYARATFILPELEPGDYSLLHCNDPCTRQLSDLLSTPFQVATDESEARLVSRFDDLESKMNTQRDRFRLRFDQIEREVFPELMDLKRRVDAVESRATELEERVQALEEGPQPVGSDVLEGGLAAGAVLLVLSLVHALTSRRSKPSAD